MLHPPPSNLMKRDRQMHRDEWMSSCLASPLSSPLRLAELEPTSRHSHEKPPKSRRSSGRMAVSFLPNPSDV